jgi:hypothetical protein
MNNWLEWLKKYHAFWLGIICLIIINGTPIFREAPSMGMLFMFLIGFFKWTKLE